jgi:hypothetical protein
MRVGIAFDGQGNELAVGSDETDNVASFIVGYWP